MRRGPPAGGERATSAAQGLGPVGAVLRPPASNAAPSCPLAQQGHDRGARVERAEGGHLRRTRAQRVLHGPPEQRPPLGRRLGGQARQPLPACLGPDHATRRGVHATTGAVPVFDRAAEACPAGQRQLAVERPAMLPTASWVLAACPARVPQPTPPLNHTRPHTRVHTCSGQRRLRSQEEAVMAGSSSARAT